MKGEMTMTQEEKPMTTMYRIGDYKFYVGDDGVEDDYHLDFLFEEIDQDNDNADYVYSHCLATLTPDQLEYLANMILDMVEYKRRKIDRLSGLSGEDECAKITDALVRNRGDRSKTASDLNISERTLYRKMKEYELDKRYGL